MYIFLQFVSEITLDKIKQNLKLMIEITFLTRTSIRVTLILPYLLQFKKPEN